MANLVIDPAHICRTFFILITAAGIGASAIPGLRQLVSYGPRTLPLPDTASPSKGNSTRALTTWNRLAKLQVPHTWFTHFYIVSVASSAFWAYQLATNGFVLHSIISRYASGEKEGMTSNQILITWTLMAIQGSRRLLESARLLKSSTAKMPMSSYALGIAFYLAAGVSIWAEGISTIAHISQPVGHVIISKPSAKTFVAILLFLIASIFQFDSHVHLASLRKYTLPEHRLFRWALCPHYSCECAIYLALALAAAPHGQLLNKTMSTVLIFTVANLAVTANSTKAWYAQKFGEEKVKQRSRMIPYIY